MRIAIFSWEALQGIPVGYVSVYTSGLCKSLAQLGHQVYLFTRLGKNQSLEENIDNFTIKRCPWDRDSSFTKEIANLAQSFYYYYQEVQEKTGDFAVVHCQDWLTIQAGLKIKKMFANTLAITFHSTEWIRSGIWPKDGDSLVISDIEAEGCSKADTLITTSYSCRRMLDAQFHPAEWKSEVIYQGVDLDLYSQYPDSKSEVRKKLGLSPEDICMLFAGIIDQNNGADILVDAINQVYTLRPEIKFILVGEGELKVELKKKLAHLKDNTVIWLNNRHGKDLIELYQACDVFIAPYRKDNSGRKILAAWAANKPVIATKKTLAEEFVLDKVNGWLISPEPQELARAIAVAAADKELCAWLGRNGRVAVETAFTWENMACKTTEVYMRRKKLFDS